MWVILMQTIKIGVIGVGKMGLNHCKTIQKINNLVLAGIYDTDPQRSQEVAQELGIQPFSSYDELLGEVEAVVIASPTSLHYEQAKKAIVQNKHVLIEKPFVTSMTEANEIEQLAKSYKGIVQIGHIERFNPVMQKMKEVANSQEIVYIESRRLDAVDRITDVDVVLDVMIHDIDLMLFLVDSPVHRISATGIAISDDKTDIAIATIMFKNGIAANLVASRATQERTRLITVTEKDRYFKAFSISQELYVYRKTKQNSFYEAEHIREKILVVTSESLLVQLKSFAEAINHNSKPIVGTRDAKEALKIALEIKKQIAKSQGANRNRTD
jgi:predicted dehydrogenase